VCSIEFSHTLHVWTLTALERGENHLKGFKDFHPKARTRIWSRLSFMCRVHSTAAPHQGYQGRGRVAIHRKKWKDAEAAFRKVVRVGFEVEGL